MRDHSQPDTPFSTDNAELLVKTSERNLRENLHALLNEYFSLVDDTNHSRQNGYDGVVVDYDFYRNNMGFLRELNSEKNSFFNPIVLIARGDPASVLPDYPLDTFHEIHDVDDESTDLRADLEPLLAVRKLTKNLDAIAQSEEANRPGNRRATRKRFKRFIYQFQTRMEELNEYLFAHSRRTATYATILAETLGWPPKHRENLYIATLLHDIGKMAIPDPILYKPGSLTEDEFDVVQDHPSRGLACLPKTEDPLMSMARKVTKHHHEKWNGGGYPDGLSGNDIPIGARIVSITDVFDALTHDRVYRDSMNEEEALNIIRENKGIHFDPELVEKFFQSLPRLRSVD